LCCCRATSGTSWRGAARPRGRWPRTAPHSTRGSSPPGYWPASPPATPARCSSAAGPPRPAPSPPWPTSRRSTPKGEIGLARAAREAGIPLTLSMMSSCLLEEVAAVGGTLWFQLYLLRDRGQVADLIQRAEAAGCRALMLTVDVPRMGRRLRDMRNG